jgi:hypothetical protein
MLEPLDGRRVDVRLLDERRWRLDPLVGRPARVQCQVVVAHLSGHTCLYA